MEESTLCNSETKSQIHRHIYSKGGYSMSWGAQNRSKDAKTPNIGPAMSEKPIFYQLFNKLTPLPARPADLKLAHWKPGINLLSERLKRTYH
jgi:hypothetical protein